MAMRNLGSSVAKGVLGFGQSISSTTKRVLVEEVGRKFMSSYITLVMSASFGYLKCTLNEKAEFDERLDSESWDCADMAERYRAKAEAVNAELMKMAREAWEK